MLNLKLTMTKMRQYKFMNMLTAEKLKFDFFSHICVSGSGMKYFDPFQEMSLS